MKIHETPNGRIVAACDENLIGSVLEEGAIFIDLKKYRSFYQGDRIEGVKLKKELSSFLSANLVGKESVDAAIEIGILNKKDVKKVKGVPYAQVYKI